MELKELAPWLAVAITLALSILVPLFTQLANNKHQLKMKEQELQRVERERALLAFEDFFKYAGGCVMNANAENYSESGASIQRLYLYLPQYDWCHLDSLYDAIKRKDWDLAKEKLVTVSRIIANELNEKNS